MWLPIPADTLYPADHLPWGLARPKAHALRPRPVVRVGDHVVDLAIIGATERDLPERVRNALMQETLNCLMGLGEEAWRAVREDVQQFLERDSVDAATRQRAIHRLADVDVLLPACIGDYTDFYSSREHATNVGVMFRGAENALNPNWLHLPVGYHGRASSVVASGHPVVRPCGQTMPPSATAPVFGPTRELDIEVEMGVFIGPGNATGTSIAADDAMRHVFGLALVNDWSARDIQRWEYVPLGPFLGKSFLTSVSPWIVSPDALASARVAAPEQSPDVLPYLRESRRETFAIAITATLTTVDGEAVTLAETDFRHLYWTPAQQIAHHTVNGCNLRAGDLLASGTISGADETSLGSLLERTWKGTRPIVLPSGATRTWLEDGDTVTLSATATRADGSRIGFGECIGTVLPAREG